MAAYKLYDDEHLLRLLSEDDERAFSAIYNRYWKSIYSVAFNRVKNQQLAEDILHDVFASLWKNRGTAQINSLENYLATSCKYLVFAQIRKNIREREYQSAQQLSEYEFSQENELLYKQLAELAAKEVETLPQRCRLVYKYKQQGLSNHEIAIEMNISQKTVENQVNKAFHHLRLSMRKVLQMFF